MTNGYDEPIARLCHVCLYSLQGHAYPARCPECGTPEIELEIRQSTLRSMSWWRVCTLGFLPKSAVQHAWTLALLPGFAKAGARRAAMVFALGVLATLTILFGSWVWSYGREPTDGRWMDRTWWYGGELYPEHSARIDDQLRSGRWRVTHHGRNCKRVILHFGNGRDNQQEVSWALIGNALRSAPTWLPHSTVHQGLRFAMTYLWGPSLILLTAVWLLVLGTDAAVGFRRAVVMYLLFCGALIPFLATIPLISVAKVGCIAWLWDTGPVTTLSQFHLMTWYLVWFRYIRAGRACPCSRWRKAAFTTTAALLTLPVLFLLVFLIVGEVGYGWI